MLIFSIFFTIAFSSKTLFACDGSSIPSDLLGWHQGTIGDYLETKPSTAAKIKESLSAWHYYHHKERESQSLIVLIHGTGASQAGWYQKKEHPHFQGFLTFGMAHAESQQTNADCISFTWNGNNTVDDRIAAAEKLSFFINSISNQYVSITLMGHSHGSNIALAASHTIQRPIDLILFATPIRTGNKTIDTREQIFSPGRSVLNAYNIYSSADILQQLGSIRSGLFLSDIFATFQSICATGSTRKIDHTVSNSYNIQVVIDGYEPGHKEIRLIAPYLPLLIAEIKRRKTSAQNFDVSIEREAKRITLSEHISLKNLGFVEQIPYRIQRLMAVCTASLRELIAPLSYCDKKELEIA
jgi:predicted esterase